MTAGIGASFDGAAIHHLCVFGNEIVATVSRFLCGDRVYIRSFFDVEIVVPGNQLDVKRGQLWDKGLGFALERKFFEGSTVLIRSRCLCGVCDGPWCIAFLLWFCHSVRCYRWLDGL